MANTKISGLPSAASLTGVELLPAVQSGSTTQATVNQVKTYVNTTPAITGGSINSTPIGATAPSTGAFTTLSASGNVSSTLDASIHGMTVGLGGGSVVNNAAVGVGALASNTTGYGNTANGYGSLTNNTTGYYNTANGSYSLYPNTTGYGNTTDGSYSLYSNTTGNYNVALGLLAGYGNSGVNSNTTGSYNIFLGFQTAGATGADTNEIVIGANAVGLGSNTTVIGSASTTMSNIKGRVLVGTTTDDGVNALQVNGTIAVGKGRIAPVTATTGITTTPTSIYTVGSSYCSVLKVFITDSATHSALDVIAVGSGGVTVTVMTSANLVGVSPARVYTIASNIVKVSIASTTCNARVIADEFI